MNDPECITAEEVPTQKDVALRGFCLAGAVCSFLLAGSALYFPFDDRFLAILIWPLITGLNLRLSHRRTTRYLQGAAALGTLLTLYVVLASGFLPIFSPRADNLGASLSPRWVWISCIMPVLSLVSWTSAVSALGLFPQRNRLVKTIVMGVRNGALLFLLWVTFCQSLAYLIRGHECSGERDNPEHRHRSPGSITTRYDDKPVVYLYPQQRQVVDVRLTLRNGELTATYPRYDTEHGGWIVDAQPDGSLTNLADGKPYSYLFWESRVSTEPDYNLTKGFVVRGTEIREVLADILPKTGLTPKEYNEFIVYWYPRLMNLPLMQVYFAGAEYDQSAPLTITPKPDSLLRVFMVVRPLEHPIELEPQEFPRFERMGFSVVEWGGTVLPE